MRDFQCQPSAGILEPRLQTYWTQHSSWHSRRTCGRRRLCGWVPLQCYGHAGDEVQHSLIHLVSSSPLQALPFVHWALLYILGITFVLTLVLLEPGGRYTPLHTCRPVSLPGAVAGKPPCRSRKTQRIHKVLGCCLCCSFSAEGRQLLFTVLSALMTFVLMVRLSAHLMSV